MKRIVALAAMAVALAPLGGCMVAIGSSSTVNRTDRVQRLEERTSRAEKTLGIQDEVKQ